MTAEDEVEVERFNENLVAMHIADTIAAFDAAKLNLSSSPDAFFKILRLHNQNESAAIARDRMEVELKKLAVYGARRSC